MTRRVVRRHEGLSRERVSIGQQALHLQIERRFVVGVVDYFLGGRGRARGFLQPPEGSFTEAAELLYSGCKWVVKQHIVVISTFYIEQ